MWSLAAIVGIAAAGLAGICVYVIYGTKVVDWRYRAETEGIMRRRTENTLRQERRIVQELSQSVVQSEKERREAEREMEMLRRRVNSLKKTMRHKRKPKFKTGGRGAKHNAYKRPARERFGSRDDEELRFLCSRP